MLFFPFNGLELKKEYNDNNNRRSRTIDKLYSLHYRSFHFTELLSSPDLTLSSPGVYVNPPFFILFLFHYAAVNFFITDGEKSEKRGGAVRARSSLVDWTGGRERREVEVLFLFCLGNLKNDSEMVQFHFLA